jgi:hypothetical protein
MYAEPAGAPPEEMGTQQQILNRRRAVLQEVAELPVVRDLDGAANRNAHCRGREHLPVRQFRGDACCSW